MKKVLFILLTCLVAVGVSAQTKQRSATKAASSSNGPVVATVNGVGPVKLRGAMEKIPAKYAGLYDKFVKTPVGENDGYVDGHYKLTFYQDGKVVMTAIAAKWSNNIYGGIREINLPADSPIKFKIAPNKYILPNCALAEVFSKVAPKSGGLAESESYMGGYTGKIGLDVAYQMVGYDGKTACVLINNDDVIRNQEFETAEKKKLSMFKADTKINGINIRFWVNEFI